MPFPGILSFFYIQFFYLLFQVYLEINGHDHHKLTLEHVREYNYGSDSKERKQNIHNRGQWLNCDFITVAACVPSCIQTNFIQPVIIAYQHKMAFSRIKNRIILIKLFLHNSKIYLKIRLYHMQVFNDGVQSIVISIIAQITISFEKADVI